MVRKAAGEAEAKLEFVDNRMTLSDGKRTVELYDIGPTPHVEHLLVAYLPKEKILFEADHFPQPRTGPLPPAVPATMAFAAALARLNLDVDRIVGAHSSRIGNLAELQAVIDSAPATTAGAP